MTVEDYRARLSQQGLENDEIEALVELKLAKSGISDVGPDAILKAATAAVKDVFPDIAKASKEDEFEEDIDEEEDEEKKIDKAKMRGLKAGEDANGRAPDQPEQPVEAEQNRESEAAFHTEMSRYGKGDDVSDFDLMKGQEDYDLVAIISKGADDIVHDVRNQSEALAKGYMAVTDVIKSVSATSRENAVNIGHMNHKIDALLKAIGQPVPPRSVVDATDIQVIESPQGNTNGGSFSARDVIAKAHEELREGVEAGRAAELSMAVAMLESGADAAEVATSAKLTIN